MVGRPVVWGLACEGEKGVHHVLSLLRDELVLAMKLCGVTSIKDITPNIVQHESHYRSKL